MDNRMTLEELFEILRAGAGEDGGAELGGDAAGTGFADLGYDSLALLETAGRVQRRYGIVLDDDVLAGAETPALFLEAVNGLLAAAAASA
jgi:minimal PKS acyl carrier protein